MPTKLLPFCCSRVRAPPKHARGRTSASPCSASERPVLEEAGAGDWSTPRADDQAAALAELPGSLRDEVPAPRVFEQGDDWAWKDEGPWEATPDEDHISQSAWESALDAPVHLGDIEARVAGDEPVGQHGAQSLAILGRLAITLRSVARRAGGGYRAKASRRERR